MGSLDMPEDFFSKHNMKNCEKLLKEYFMYEYLFMSENKSLNPLKFKKDKKISVTSFDNYFRFPMILNRSIFRALGESQKSLISLDQYVEGMSTIYTGKLNERILFIYKMFNLNKDEYIHKADVSLILNYTHIFSNKRKQDLLKLIIYDFFGEHSLLTLQKFVNILRKKNSDLYFIIMCIFFEYQTFNKEILSVFENEGVNIKNDIVKNLKSCSKLDININSFSDLKRPSSRVIEYILINYGYDLNILSKGKKQEPEYSDSLDSTEELDGQDEEGLVELNNFENDVQVAKEFYVENAFELECTSPPRGSYAYFELNDGAMTSMFSSRIRQSRMNSSRSFSYNSAYKRSSKSPSNFAVASKNRSSVPSSYVPLTPTRSCVNSGCDYVSIGIGNEGIKDEYFNEEVLFLNDKGEKKPYTIILIKGFLLILKRKKGNAFSLENKLSFYKLKKFIPLHRLYVDEVEEGIVLNETIYSKLKLVSTIKPFHESFEFLFERLARLNDLVKQIMEKTNYVSLSKEYVEIKDIGKGGFAQIKLMLHKKTSKMYSVKKISKKVNSVESFTCQNWEKDIVTFLKYYPDLVNIIKFHRIVESADHIYIVMEYVESGTLGSFLTKSKTCLKSTKVKEIVKQLCNGVRQLHSYGIIHRDLKLENILIDCKEKDTFQLKIIDFGLSQVLTPLAKTNEKYGTLFYSSPEILLRAPYNSKVDVWSIGILAHYLEFTFIPFGIKGKEESKEISERIIVNKLRIPEKRINDNILNKAEEKAASKALVHVIKNCLCKDMNMRPTCEDIYHFLSTI